MMNCRFARLNGGCGRFTASALLAAFLLSQAGFAGPQAIVPGIPADFPSTPNGPEALSPEELDALGLIMEAGTPFEVIARAEAFSSQYPDSQLLPLALLREMKAEIQLNSYEGAVAIGHEILHKNAQNLEALALLASILPNFPASYPAERKAKALREAEDYIRAARQLLRTFHLPEGVSAPSFLNNKRKLSLSLQESAGFVALVAGNYEGAIREYRLALEANPNPSAATWLRLGVAYYRTGQFEKARLPLERAMQTGTEIIQKEAEKLLKEIAANHDTVRSAREGGEP